MQCTEGNDCSCRFYDCVTGRCGGDLQMNRECAWRALLQARAEARGWRANAEEYMRCHTRAVDQLNTALEKARQLEAERDKLRAENRKTNEAMCVLRDGVSGALEDAASDTVVVVDPDLLKRGARLIVKGQL